MPSIRSWIVRRAVAAVTLLVSATSASADAIPARFLAEGGEAKPTKAWEQFCAEQPDECKVNLFDRKVISYTEQFWRDLVTVNVTVNREITAITDLEQWGVTDRWDYPDNGMGDCEDIQIEKRRRLVGMGYPARAMRMAVVVSQEGEGHAVLIVRSDRGDFVLDNRVDAVLPWYRVRYHWVKREADDGESWVALGVASAPVETAGNGK
jgi:predicted transglutaminase-like cysteine proteinase